MAAGQDRPGELLDQCPGSYRDDPRLVAVGEIGLDYFVPELEPLARASSTFTASSCAWRAGMACR
jgi:Tat protein secretion system quality control protein TatD with DNase activity